MHFYRWRGVTVKFQRHVSHALSMARAHHTRVVSQQGWSQECTVPWRVVAGEVAPVTDAGKAYTIFFIPIGLMCCAITFSKVTSLLRERDIDDALEQQG